MYLPVYHVQFPVLSGPNPDGNITENYEVTF